LRAQPQFGALTARLDHDTVAGDFHSADSYFAIAGGESDSFV
jgi:hypothetical protein